MAVSQQQRQKQLFAAEDWRVLYTAFTQINFNAYDFNTIRSAMVNYIRLNYPEDFNDWIESSEFVAIIDLLSYLGTSLAFRMDLNTRENFLDTAQRRESIFKLARMLSYQPQRCITSVGLLKLTQIVTNQDIYDSNGTNLKSIPINWNDQNNPDWYEQWILVLNASLNSTNYFGNPSKSGLINGINTELYAMNNTFIPTSVLPFSTSVAGIDMQFELVNPDFNTVDTPAASLGTAGYFFERPPNPINSWYIIYRTDGNGFGSPDTGFFFMFKQGSMSYTDFRLDLPLANRILDVNSTNVNQTDVWVQTVDTNGLVSTQWTQVPAVNGFNVIYNSIDKNVRNIFSVITRDNAGNDQISIRFADGNFGNVPIGLIRVWTRVSNNLQYQIRPTDMSNLKFNFNYTDVLDNRFAISFNSSLQYTVNNSQARETNDQIKLRASQVYYTQDRMVNGEDYNIFPLQSSQALKVKAVNRIYSGQSRYLDINDPTGTYQDTNILADDGILYWELTYNRQETAISPSQSSIVVAANNIQPMINGSNGLEVIANELRDFFYAYYPAVTPSSSIWKLAKSSTNSSTGYFEQNNTPLQLADFANPGSTAAYIAAGSLIKFMNAGWVSIVSIIGDGTGINQTGLTSAGTGAVTLSAVVDSNDIVMSIYPAWRTTLNTVELASISVELNKKQSFGIRYDALNRIWAVITNDNLSSSDTFSLTYSGDTSSTGKDASWLLRVIYNTNSWVIISRAQRYIMESVRDVRFYYNNKDKVVDSATGKALLDNVDVLGVNTQPDYPTALGVNYQWKIQGQEIYADGYAEPRSVLVTFWETQQLGIPDNPEEFINIVAPFTGSAKFVFWQKYTSSDGYEYYNPISWLGSNIYNSMSNVPSASSGALVEGTVIYVVDINTFYRYSANTFIDVSTEYKVRQGRNGLIFIWKHYAPYDQRIDPAIMNVIDAFVLTASYNTDIRNWINTNGSPSTMPMPPNTEDLKATFSYFEQFKMMTDEIIWHPVTYKLLFGMQAPPELQVIFKVVKVTGSSASDNEVKSLVKEQIDNYFSLANWDFGQSFFFTELATYIHMNLATIVASVVIVPKSGQAKFGDLFEIVAQPDEIFISCAKVTDIQIVSSLSESQLGLTNG